MMSRVKGWCPDLFTPMQAMDGLLVRLRPDLGRFSGEQLLQVAELAERFGSGIIELTNRGNLQLRGFRSETLRRAVAQAVVWKLVDADPAKEKRRSILVSPLADRDPDCHPQTRDCALLLKEALTSDPAFEALPGKFSFAVDGGGHFPAGSLSADLALQADEGGWSIVCGAFRSGILTMRAAVDVVLAVLQAFVSTPVMPPRPSRLPASGESLLLKAGVDVLPEARISKARISKDSRAVAVGSLPGGCTGLGAMFGRLRVDDLRRIVVLAGGKESFISLTPWRSLVVPRVLSDVDGFVTDPHDSWLRVQACIGTKGCVQAGADVEQVARQLAAHVPRGRVVHVSGCPKGCAHPARADMTVVAMQGRYDVVVHGKAGNRPYRSGMELAGALTLVKTQLEKMQA